MDSRLSKVGFAAAVGCREDAIEDAMAGGDDRLKKLDERVLDGVVAVDKEELGGRAVETVERHFHCIDLITASA